MPTNGHRREPHQLGGDLAHAIADVLAHDTAFAQTLHQRQPLFFRGAVTAQRTTGGMRQVKVQRTGQSQADGTWYAIYDAGYAPTVGDDVLGLYVDRRASAVIIGARTGPGHSGTLLFLDSAVTALADPTTPPTLTATSPGTPTALAAGTYHVGYLWTTLAGGRTKLSLTAAITITAGQGIQGTAPALPAGASGVEFYVDDCAVGIGDTWAGGITAGAGSTGGWRGGASLGDSTTGGWSGGVTNS